MLAHVPSALSCHYIKPCNKPDLSPQSCLCPWRSPKLSHFNVALWQDLCYTGAQCGSSRNTGHTATSQHQPFPRGCVGRWWGPAEDRGGCGATGMGNHLFLATAANSLEQPETQPCQVGRQPKAHSPGERWGIKSATSTHTGESTSMLAHVPSALSCYYFKPCNKPDFSPHSLEESRTKPLSCGIVAGSLLQ